MTSSQDFWARKLAQQQPVVRDTPPVSNQPWWQIGTPPQVQTVQDSAIVRHGGGKATLEGTNITVDLDESGQYRPRKASHLKRSGLCPECDSQNFGRGEDTSRAMRCFNCGYVEGRNIADSNRPLGITSDGRSFEAKQITTMNVVDNTGKAIGTTNAASGKFDNYHGPAKDGSGMTAADIMARVTGV